MRLGCIVYGSPEQLSGGYRYDRELIRAARKRGHRAEFLSVQPGEEILPARYVEYDLLLIDELCHPDLRSVAGAPPCFGIVHHLAWSEALPLSLRLRHRRQERRFLRALDGHIFNTRATRDASERVAGDALRGKVVYPGREPSSNAAEAASTAGQGKTATILSVSNLIPRKGLHRVLGALSHIARRGDVGRPWRYLIVGAETDPAYVARLRALAAGPELEGRVEFCGRLDREALSAAYGNADIFCLPSDHEGFGIVYLEAMGAGCVPIASASGGAGEIIRSGSDGFLIESKRDAPLRTVLKRLIEDSDYRMRLSTAAVERWRAFDTWESSMEKGIEWLELQLLTDVSRAQSGEI